MRSLRSCVPGERAHRRQERQRRGQCERDADDGCGFDEGERESRQLASAIPLSVKRRERYDANADRENSPDTNDIAGIISAADAIESAPKRKRYRCSVRSAASLMRARIRPLSERGARVVGSSAMRCSSVSMLVIYGYRSSWGSRSFLSMMSALRSRLFRVFRGTLRIRAASSSVSASR